MYCTEDDQHAVTIVPHSSLGLPFDNLDQAIRFARGIAAGRQAPLWRTTDGQTFEPL